MESNESETRNLINPQDEFDYWIKVENMGSSNDLQVRAQFYNQ